jgi:hypothetical protein
MAIPKDPPSNLERYSQQVFRGLLTSSEINGFTSLFATLDCGAGDVRGGYLNPPYQNWRLMVNESARVLEIDGPQSWHNLCMAYPAKKSSNLSHPDFSGDAGQIVPDWAMVKSDWDAVHLTFGGLLTAEQVRVQSPDGWTYLWGWNSELTLWLRWAFTSVEHLPDYVPRRPSFLPNLGFLEKLLR